MFQLIRPKRLAMPFKRHFFFTLCLIGLVSAVALLQSQPVAHADSDLSSHYTWKPLTITGGGWVVGMTIDPNVPDVMYARTDVGGAYKWDVTNQRWNQLMTVSHIGTTFVNTDQAPYGGGIYRDRAMQVEGIAVDPGNQNNVYMGAGTDAGNQTGVIFYSTDGSATFQQATTTPAISICGNCEGRMFGQRFAVDPHNSNIIYYGSRSQGLYVSTNKGVTWNALPSTTLPFGLSISGTNFGVGDVQFDPGSTLIGGKTSRIYASVAGQGIYESDDAGTTWNNISTGTNSPDPTIVATEIHVVSGYAIVAFSSGNNGAGTNPGLRKYVPGTGWSDISPPGFQGWLEIAAVDPNNPQRIFASNAGMQQLYRTLDGGANWATVPRTCHSGSVAPWLDLSAACSYLSTGDMAFDPFHADTLWFSEGFAMWKANNLTGSTIAWQNMSTGIEETVPNTVIAPPGGNPITGIDDQNGFYHSNPDVSPAQMNFTTSAFSAGTSYAYFPGDPTFVVGTSTDTRNCCNPHGGGYTNFSGYSTNGGQTWNPFVSIANQTHPSDLRWGTIAISATDKTNMVWAPDGNYNGSWPPTNDKPYYTKDGGATWNRIGYFDSYEVGDIGYFVAKHVLAADQVNGGTFYLYTWGKLSDTSVPAYVQRSTDGGVTWTALPTTLPRLVFHGTLAAVPGKAGDLWFVTGWDHEGPAAERGIYHSTDSGASFTHLANFSEAWQVAFGKAASGANYPAIYVYGNYSGAWGLYRSTDGGTNWDKLVDYPLGYFSTVRALAADMNVFGKVYLGLDSIGFVYGTTDEVPAPTATNTPNGTVTPTLTSTATATATTILPDLTINKATPATDASLDAVWNAQTPQTIGKAVQGTLFPAQFRTTWDHSYLYVMTEVTDPDINNDSGNQWWNDDTVEVYIDSTNAKPTSFGANQFHYFLRRGDSTVHEANGNGTTGVVMNQVEVTGGYRIVAAFPWTALNIAAPSAPYNIGLEMQVDNDEGKSGGLRDAQIDWHVATNNAYQFPSLWGTAQLIAPAPTSTATATAMATTTSTSTPTATSTPLPGRIDSIGIYRGGKFYLRLHNSFGYADISAPFTAGTKPYPIVGDWTGAGFDSIGVFDHASGNFFLRNTITAGSADETFTLGNPNDTPLSGRWQSSATHAGAGVFRPSNGILYLKNALTTGFANYAMVMGIPGDEGVAGDWTGKGFDSPGIYRPGVTGFFLSNQVTSGVVYGDISATFGNATDLPITGDWSAQGHDGIGMFRSTNGYVYLKNILTSGFADNAFFYGIAGDKPIAGHWQPVYPPVPAPVLIARTAVSGGAGIVPGGNQIGD